MTSKYCFDWGTLYSLALIQMVDVLRREPSGMPADWEPFESFFYSVGAAQACGMETIDAEKAVEVILAGMLDGNRKEIERGVDIATKAILKYKKD